MTDQPLDPESIFAALDAPGAAPFAELRARALVISLGDRRIPIAGRDDLISMKRASGRPVDLADIAALTEPEHQRKAV